MLINPTQHRRDNCQKHCHYGCYDRRETFIDLEFDALLFVLFINFMVGLHDGMRAGNLAAILVNGVLVLAVIASEKEEK